MNKLISAKNKNAKFFVILFLGLFILGNWINANSFRDEKDITTQNENSDQNNSISATKPFASAIHAPIVIVNNISSFSDKTGSGIKTAPFVIENMQISSLTTIGSSETSLWIEDTAEYLIIRNIVIENIIDTVGTTVLIYIRNSSHIVLENIMVRNCDISSSINYICYIRELENITVSGLSISNYTDSWIIALQIFECSKSIFENIFINDINCQGIYGIEIGQSTNMIVDSFTFSNITGDSSSMLLTINECENTTLSNSRFEDIIVGSVNSDVIRGSNNTISNSLFHNITTTDALVLFVLQELDTTYFSGNRIDSLTSLDDSVTIFFLNTGAASNYIFNNRISNLNAENGNSYCVYGSVGADSNIIWYNQFLSGSIIAFDDGNTQYFNLFYFKEYQISNPIGNYWWDYQLDADSGFHFIVGTPREIEGAGNLNDPYPIHYFAIDFDGDNLNNYEENQQNTDVWDADSDDDGLSDGIDPDPLHNNATPIENLFNIFSNPTNLLLIGVILLLIVNIFVSKRRSGSEKPSKESRKLK